MVWLRCPFLFCNVRIIIIRVVEVWPVSHGPVACLVGLAIQFGLDWSFWIVRGLGALLYYVGATLGGS